MASRTGRPHMVVRHSGRGRGWVAGAIKTDNLLATGSPANPATAPRQDVSVNEETESSHRPDPGRSTIEAGQRVHAPRHRALGPSSSTGARTMRVSNLFRHGGRTGAAIMPVLRMTAEVHASIRASVGHAPAESGGPLGGDRADNTATLFEFDSTGRATAASYTPDEQRLNRLFETWNAVGKRLLGNCHSHPRGYLNPSPGDLDYATRIFETIPSLQIFFLPIVQSDADGGPFEILPWAAVRGPRGIEIVPAELQIVAPKRTTVLGGDVFPLGPAFPLRGPVPPVEMVPRILELYARGNGQPWQGDPEAVIRIVDAYDIPRLASARLILVGVGGARGLAQDLARAQVMEYALIDPDVVSTSNLATQFASRQDIGLAKVECARADILDIVPDAEVRTFKTGIESIDAETFKTLARSPWRQAVVYDPNQPDDPLSLEPLVPSVTILCGFSDSFPAQALVNTLAIAHELPCLCAQMYRDGRAAEITFTYPGVTRACHRCMLEPRYKAYDTGYRNDVTSAGAPIFSTQRANALTGFVALAMLHHGSTHPRWGNMLGRMDQRSLIQVRMDPDLASSLGMHVFDRVLAGADQQRIFFDEAVWLPQEPTPDCPDCAGAQAVEGRS